MSRSPMSRSPMSRQQKYTRYLPPHLMKSLTISHEYRSRKRLFKDLSSLSTARCGLIKSDVVIGFCDYAGCGVPFKPLPLFAFNQYDVTLVLCLACEYGWPDLAVWAVEMIGWKYGSVMLTARNMHWDILDPYFRTTRGLFLGDIVTTSLPVLLYAKQHPVLDVPSPYSLFSSAIYNCYTYGFDQDLLEHVIHTTPNHPGTCIMLVNCERRCIVYHETAPTTLRFLIRAFHNTHWIGTSARDLLKDSHYATAPAVLGELTTILLEAGCDP